MYFWSIDPEYLDNRGLVELWRDGFKALALYKRGNLVHNSVKPFMSDERPDAAIAEYLEHVASEGHRRDINFDIARLEEYVPFVDMNRLIEIPYAQICLDYVRLMERLERHDPQRKVKVEASLGLFSRKSGTVQITKLKPNPIFTIVHPQKGLTEVPNCNKLSI